MGETSHCGLLLSLRQAHMSTAYPSLIGRRAVHPFSAFARHGLLPGACALDFPVPPLSGLTTV
jgi:hypothetical protein